MFIPRRSPLQNRIFDIFNMGGGGQQQTPQNGGQQTPPQNGGQQGNPGNMERGQQGNGNPNPNANLNDPNSVQNGSQSRQQGDPNNKQNQSPLAEFASLWENDPAPKNGEAVEPNWDDHSSIVPEMNVDPKKMIESAKRIDFSKVMNPERVQAALKGDVGAFNEVINNVAQAAFANMAMSTTRIVKAMTGQMAEKMYTGALPHHFRKHQISQQITQDNPIFSDPAVAPMLEMAKSQFQTKYPKATAKEISEMAKNYVLKFAEAVIPKDKQNASANGTGKGGLNKSGSGMEDWGNFFGLDEGQP